eukprot:scaffold217969_cov24-Tisochrysis_lutea.AAC.3
MAFPFWAKPFGSASGRARVPIVARLGGVLGPEAGIATVSWSALEGSSGTGHRLKFGNFRRAHGKSRGAHPYRRLGLGEPRHARLLNLLTDPPVQRAEVKSSAPDAGGEGSSGHHDRCKMASDMGPKTSISLRLGWSMACVPGSKTVAIVGANEARLPRAPLRGRAGEGVSVARALEPSPHSVCRVRLASASPGGGWGPSRSASGAGRCDDDNALNLEHVEREFRLAGREVAEKEPAVEDGRLRGRQASGA